MDMDGAMHRLRQLMSNFSHAYETLKKLKTLGIIYIENEKEIKRIGGARDSGDLNEKTMVGSSAVNTD